MELTLLAVLILGVLHSSWGCTYSPSRLEVTAFGTKKHYCDYTVRKGNVAVNVSLVPGSRIRTNECWECHCTRDGLQCCGYGVLSTKLVVPKGCRVIADGCDARFVLESDNTTRCASGRPLDRSRPRLRQAMINRTQQMSVRPQAPVNAKETKSIGKWQEFATTQRSTSREVQRPHVQQIKKSAVLSVQGSIVHPGQGHRPQQIKKTPSTTVKGNTIRLAEGRQVQHVKTRTPGDARQVQHVKTRTPGDARQVQHGKTRTPGDARQVQQAKTRTAGESRKVQQAKTRTAGEIRKVQQAKTRTAGESRKVQQAKTRTAGESRKVQHVKTPTGDGRQGQQVKTRAGEGRQLQHIKTRTPGESRQDKQVKPPARGEGRHAQVKPRTTGEGPIQLPNTSAPVFKTQGTGHPQGRAWGYQPFHPQGHFMTEESMLLMRQMMIFRAMSNGGSNPLQNIMLMSMLEL